jgi:hypothetical protein
LANSLAQIIECAGVLQDDVPLLPLDSAFRGVRTPRLLRRVWKRAPQVPDLEPVGAEDGCLVLETHVGGHDTEGSRIEAEPIHDHTSLLGVPPHTQPRSSEATFA